MTVDFNSLRIQLGRFYNETVEAIKETQKDGDFQRLERPLNDLRDMVVTLCALIPEGEEDSVLSEVGDFAVFEADKSADDEWFDNATAAREERMAADLGSRIYYSRF